MDAPRASVHLLHGPYVMVGRDRREVPEGGKRLLALLAIRGGVPRPTVAEVLWPQVEQRRAAGNLRSACWRLRGAGIELVTDHAGVLWIDHRVGVDVDTIGRHAVRMSGGGCVEEDVTLVPWLVDALDLLPGWYEEWVCEERERLRAVALDALDAVSGCLRRAQRWPEAIDTALVAVVADPLRPTSQGALIAAHLREGNLVEARRAFTDYRQLLHRELGLEPPPVLAQLVGARPRVGRPALPENRPLAETLPRVHQPRPEPRKDRQPRLVPDRLPVRV